MQLLKLTSAVFAAATILSAHPVAAQQNTDSAQLAAIVKALPPLAPVKVGQTAIPLPTAPAGYNLLLKGSDRMPVINLDGHVTTPLTDATVNLYFVLQRQSDGAETDVPMSVAVSGRYGAPQADQPFVIPALREWHGYTGHYTLTPKARVIIDPAYAAQLESVAQRLTADIAATTSTCKITYKTGKPAAGDIFLTLAGADANLGKEGYQLDINSAVTVTATHPTGVLWGAQTILQLLQQSPARNTLPKGITRDYPKYAVRGFVLDAGRKFFSMEFLRNYVKFMSYYKMNDFHVHLNDNGFAKFFGDNWDSTYSAFRLENSTYPGLTAKDGSYSKKEFIALQKMADSFGVRIIPEIDVPAHSLALSKALPAVASDKYGRDHLNLEPVSWQMVDNIFKEYLEGPQPVFIGDEVHIGTDEYDKKESEKFRAFTDHLIKYVEGYGKKVRMWGSLTHAKGTTPVKSTGVTMNAWYNGYAEPRDMIKLGYDLISTPDGWLYIVPAAGYYYDYLNISRIYNKWEPNMIGKEVFPFGHPKIKGGAFAVWNDHPGNGITAEDVHDRAFPAMQVLAEKMWTGYNAHQPYKTYLSKSKYLPEGPGLNLQHKLYSKDSILIAYDFKSKKDISGNKHDATTLVNGTIANSLKLNGGRSYLQTPVDAIGYGYTISFDIKPDKNNPANAVLFSGPTGAVKLLQQQTGKLGFSREGYDYYFNYSVPAETWTHIEISGDNKGTLLFVNGVLTERLEGAKISFTNTKDKIAKVQTLVFPFKYIGDTANAFVGELKHIRVTSIKK
ncbi:hexosaminidase [Chitinophaga jiangningensis]|uniref:Hexosaminidase n=1 Tax=Chitinophaga jiangningensis TaxID=1419482 RepID=A0A1M6W869_9BACT|nr:family 20 glycosylhydrolase [Chitinophaga jiangningensis]SHK89829.1 hexosaminidase [Chitinophaga jiangningensis]